MAKYLITWINIDVPDIDSADKVFVDILKLKKFRGTKNTAEYVLNKDTRIIAYKVNDAMKDNSSSLQLTTTTENILKIKERLEKNKFFFQRVVEKFKKPINLFSYHEDKNKEGSISRIVVITFLYTWGQVTLGD
ncbi:MAG: hypothetical protein AAB546_04550 [Patescibacteria group bacterium]